MAPPATLLDLLGPQRCAGCGVRGAALCARCAANVPRPALRRRIPGISRLLVPLSYEGAARGLVLELKLGARRAAAVPLAEAMCREVARWGLAGDALSWVPARRSDIRARGFDHAAVIAEEVEARLGMPALPLIRRVGPLRPDQVGLSARERADNLRGRSRPARVRA